MDGKDVMMNGTDPEKMTAEQRLQELAMLLAPGLLRLWSKRREPRQSLSGNCLELPAETSPPAIDP